LLLVLRTSNSFQGPFLAKRIESVPTAANITQIRSGRIISPWVIVLNVLAIALWTTGVFASLYALGARELARQRAPSRTKRPQRDAARAFGPKPSQPARPAL
jgi:Alternate to MurJ